MAFVKAHIEIKPASVGTGLKVTLRRGKNSPATMTVSLNASVAKQANIAGGDKLEVMIGDGEHHGLIRLRKNNSVGEAVAVCRDTGKATFYIIKLGHQSAFVDRSEAASWCQFEIVEDGWLEIALPKWADETAPKKKALPVSTSLPPRPAPDRQTVTAAVMGDPPPGRREMLAKIGNIKG